MQIHDSVAHFVPGKALPVFLSPHPPTHKYLQGVGAGSTVSSAVIDRGCLRQCGGNFYLNSLEINSNCKISDSRICVRISDSFNLESKMVEQYVYLETTCMFA